MNIKTTTLLIIFITCTILACKERQKQNQEKEGAVTGSAITRNPGESALAFIQRNAPDSLDFSDELATQMLTTKEWTADSTIIGFYSRSYKLSDDDMDYTDILGYLYLPVGHGKYKRVFIDTFENEGGTACISSIFYANADKDAARELVILIKWHSTHYQIDGDIYETRIYDNVPSGTYPDKLTFLKDISKEVSGTFDGYNEGENMVSGFKTAKEIRAELKKQGY